MFNINDRKAQNILVNCDHGLMIINRFDNDPLISVGTFLLDHGNNNTVEADLTVRALLDIPNPVIFDVGSNIGTYATWVARWAKTKQGKVYCFEPQRQIFQILCGNMAINNIDNVYAYNIGLGKEETFIDIPEVDYTKPNSSFGAFSLDGVDRNRYSNLEQTQRIKISTLDNFVSEWKIEKVDFIKIDAEGLDVDVMEGGLNTIKKFMPDLFVEFLNLGSSKKEDTSSEGKDILVDYLKNLGYNTHLIGNDIFATTKQYEQQ
jgi:FkbM family methyltransferase